MPRKLLPAALTFIAILADPGKAQAQSTISSTSANSTAPSTTLPDWPVNTIFYPLDAPPNLGASIITARANATVYAISCVPTRAVSDASSQCSLVDPITVTEGPSTLVYTMTYGDSNQGMTPASPATINCVLSGSPLATAATCTGRSAISGLGTIGSTSVLSASQIKFAEVTITAGLTKLNAVPTGLGRNGSGGASSSSGVALRAAATGAAWVVGGAMGLVGVVEFL